MKRRKGWIRTETARVLITCGLLLPGLLLPFAAFPAPTAPTMDDVRLEASRGGHRLSDLAALRARLEGEPGRVLLVDTRQDWEHRTGYIPGSAHLPCEPARSSRLRAARQT